LGDHVKFSQIENSKFLKSVNFEEARLTRIEPMKFEVKIERAGFLNMLYVSNFNRKIINTICVHQLLVPIHDGYLWLGGPISIDDMLVHKITMLPYLGVNHTDTFVGMSHEKKLVDQMNRNFRLVKRSEAMPLALYQMELCSLLNIFWQEKQCKSFVLMKCR